MLLALRRWLLLALCMVGLYYLWPALSYRVYEPQIYDPLKRVSLEAAVQCPETTEAGTSQE